MAQVAAHGKLLLQRLHQQREMDLLCDITIIVKDAEFRAHKNILACFSKYFSSLASKGFNTATLDPEKVSKYALEKLLEFVYTGQMNLSSSLSIQQNAVRRAAEFLGIPDAIKDFPGSAQQPPDRSQSKPAQSKAKGNAKRKPSQPSETPLSCSQCKKTFKDQSGLRKHEKTHSDLKPFSCTFCPKTFRAAKQLKSHLRSHTGEKPFACTNCDKCFAQRSQLTAHRRMDHGEEGLYTCDYCGYKCAFISQYNNHLRLHTGEKPFACDICGQAFTHSSGLTYHKRRHTGEKPFQCDLCGMSFSVSSTLVVHRRKHTGEKPYKCDVCGKNFSGSSSLIVHRRIHTGEAPYKCPEPNCVAKFVKKSDLLKHTKRIHSGETPHKCPDPNCFSTFGTLTDLNIHYRRIHKRETPHKCPEPKCDSKFFTLGELKKHSRVHSGGNSGVQCLLCEKKFAKVKTLMKHQEKAHANEVRQHTQQARAVVLLAPLPNPAVPMVTDPSGIAMNSGPAAALLQDFKAEPAHAPISAEAAQTISSETLQALVQQLRPSSPATNLEQIIIIQTVDTPTNT